MWAGDRVDPIGEPDRVGSGEEEPVGTRRRLDPDQRARLVRRPGAHPCVGIGDRRSGPAPSLEGLVAIEFRIDPPFGDDAARPLLDHLRGHRRPRQHTRRLTAVFDDPDSLVVEDDRLDGSRLVGDRIEEIEVLEAERSCRGERELGLIPRGRRIARRGEHLASQPCLLTPGHWNSHRWTQTTGGPTRSPGSECPWPGVPDRIARHGADPVRRA